MCVMDQYDSICDHSDQGRKGHFKKGKARNTEVCLTSEGVKTVGSV